MKKILTVIVISVFLFSCNSDDDYANLRALQDQQIQQYLTENNLIAKTTASGLYYIINEQGTGQAPTQASSVRINHKVSGIDGTVYINNTDMNAPDGLEFEIKAIIPALREGCVLIQEGGSITVIAPSGLGTDNNIGLITSNIPINSVQIFDIKLLKVIN